MFAEYIWMDGTKPTKKLRSKTKVIEAEFTNLPWGVAELPEWGFDGSSTGQATGDKSDCALKPVFVCPDPIRGIGHILVLCEVFEANGQPHETNTRARLRETLNTSPNLDAWFGLEQEYTLFKGSSPLGFGQDRRFPPAQGPYYCGVGADEAYGRPLVEAHMKACVAAGLKISGINAEVMPGQWEFQVGPLGPLEVGDHLWVARWLLYRLGEDFGIHATLDAKPVTGDWNGAGMHSNFSTAAMRASGSEGTDENVVRSAVAAGRAGDAKFVYGMDAITEWCERARLHVPDHLKAYGDGIEMRLTGRHETCSYKDFKYGVSDRTASIRIPMDTARKGHGYLEDRRPNANADPYEVASVMLKTAANLW